MEEERYKEETKVEEQDLVTFHPPLLPRELSSWLIITDREYASERLIFYSIAEKCYYVRFIPELQNKYVACCYGGLFVLRDKSTNDCEILNILTMERLQLPPLYTNTLDCVISSPKMDGSCRVIFYEIESNKCWSCHLGDSEYIELKLTFVDENNIQELINFKGKLYALTICDWNLSASDFSDPDLHHEQVVSGESLKDFIFTGREKHIYLVESFEDLLLIFMGGYDHEVCDVKICKADFSSGQWVKLDTLGDSAIFLGSHNNTFSSPTTTLGMEGNAIYWVRTPMGRYPPETHLYKYDIEDKSISMSLPILVVGSEEYSQIQTNLHVQLEKVTIESTESQIEQRKANKRKDRGAIGTTIARKESLWADLHHDLLLEIFPHLFAGDTVAFRSVCRSWYSVSPPSCTTQQFVLPLQSSDSSPLLMCPYNKALNPIHGKLYSMDFPDIPGDKVRAARDGWLLVDFNSTELFFYNPVTKAEFELPLCDARYFLSVYFSAPPTSADCLVVVAVNRWNGTFAICFWKYGDEGWTCRKISPEKESFYFSSCNAVVYKGLYYFLGHYAKLLIFNPNKDEVRVIEAPKFISELKGQRYMLESDGKLLAIFLGMHGSSVYTCEWNASTSKWEILGSLGNLMLFVSRPLSLCKRATVSGTGNKIYFPRVVGDGHILFYSLATGRYHTFEMGTSYSNFFPSKFYPEHNGWFMP